MFRGNAADEQGFALGQMNFVSDCLIHKMVSIPFTVCISMFLRHCNLESSVTLI